MKKLPDILVPMTFAAFAFVAVSCGKGGSPSGPGGDPLSPPEIKISETSVSYKKGSQFVSVTASGAWTISVSSGWASVTPSSGSGAKNNVILSYEENASEEPRNCTITITSGSKSGSGTITQAGKSSSGGDSDSGGDGGEGGSTDDGSISTAGWLELPGMTSTAGYDFFYHTMTLNGRTERNYSFYYSYSDLVSLWVAYPLVSAHMGSSGRTDEWAYDPLIPSGKQAALSGAFRESGSYSRGHQIPSADRTVSRSINASTFYFTNMTPQNHTLNGGLWASLENQVRNWAKSSDTLYVVTGCVVKGSTAKAHDNEGKEVTVPVGYYKAFLRYARNSTLGFNGYMAGAVYFNHNASATAQVMSVDDLEQKLGMDFFPNLAGVVGQDTAGKVEAQDPKTVSWWGL